MISHVAVLSSTEVEEEEGEDHDGPPLSAQMIKHLAQSAPVGVENLLSQVPLVPGIDKEDFILLFQHFRHSGH